MSWWDDVSEEDKQTIEEETVDLKEAVEDMEDDYQQLANEISDSLEEYNRKMYGDDK